MWVNLVGTAAHVKLSETRLDFVHKTRLEHLHNYNMNINYGITGLKILCNGSSFIIKTLGILILRFDKRTDSLSFTGCHLITKEINSSQVQIAFFKVTVIHKQHKMNTSSF